MEFDKDKQVSAYKFRAGSVNDLDSLYEDYIWCSSYDDLNDPYEAKPHYDPKGVDDGLRDRFLTFFYKKENGLDELSASLRVNSIRHKLGTKYSNFIDKRVESMLFERWSNHRKRCGVFSFSYDSPCHPDATLPEVLANFRLWAHYANGFRGYCVEYDFEELKLAVDRFNDQGGTFGYRKVDYRKNTLPSLKLRTFIDSYISDDGKHSDELLKVLSSKHEWTWGYENEARLISPSVGKFKISPECIRSIFISNKMSMWMKDQIASSVLNKNAGIKIYAIDLDHSEYKLRVGLWD